jgi:UDP-N-acetylmuramoyl-tripeptide--D-alanyl-D-alanine ligase
MRVLELMKITGFEVQKALSVDTVQANANHGLLAEPIDEISFNSVSTDSRTINKGDLFFALVGERFDGHNFVEDALAKGAVGVVISKDIHPSRGIVYKVKDTLKALGELAKSYRCKFDIRCIAVTGSNGKTTTKEILAACLGTSFHTLKTTGNFNNLIGLPLSLFNLDEKYKFGVFELAMSAPSEISRLAKICRPQVGVFTNIAPVHLQTMKSIEAVAKAKFELVESLPSDGVVVLNADDEYLAGWRKLITRKVITYSLENEADFRVWSIESSSGGASSFKLKGVKYKINIPGIHNIYNAAAAIATASYFGCDPQSLVEPIADVKAYHLRSEVFESSGVIFINDCYNANPVSMRLAIDTLVSYPAKGRKIAVFSDMLELGDDEKDFHIEVGEYLNSKNVDALFVFGQLARNYLERFKGSLKEHFREKTKLAESLKKFVHAGDVVLVKGSRAMALEEISEMFEGKS